MTNKTDALNNGLMKMIKYLPQVYAQREQGNLGEIYIKYPYQEIPSNSLLFVLPIKGSEIDGNKLIIRYGKVSADGQTISYTTSKIYRILVEDIDGNKRDATTGDILPDRLCIFRFLTNDSKSVILCNSPLHGEMVCSGLYVSGETTFAKMPTVNGVRLVSYGDYKTLEEKVKKLEAKFITGTISAEEYFSENNVPEGTIYLQTEE
jgi:hypothetical protein